MKSKEEILEYREDLMDMRDDMDHHAMECELSGRIKALEWTLGERSRCSNCGKGVLSPIYKSDSVEPVAHVCDRCGEKYE